VVAKSSTPTLDDRPGGTELMSGGPSKGQDATTGQGLRHGCCRPSRAHGALDNVTRQGLDVLEQQECDCFYFTHARLDANVDDARE
jgi:hypothetical protein